MNMNMNDASFAGRRSLVRYALIVLALSTCGTQATTATDAPAMTGAVTLPLVTTALSGHRYRLRNIQMQISQSSPIFYYRTFTDADAGTADSAITASVPVGPYSAYLYNYLLERDDGSGTFSAVRAELVQNSIAFSIFSGTTSTLIFQFRTDGIVVATGMGSLSAKIDVTETAPLCEALSTTCGVGRWCPPSELTGTPQACLSAGTKRIGARCSGPTDCEANASCFDLGSGAVCAPLCASAGFGQPCPSGGTCKPVGTTYGLCRPPSETGGNGGGGSSAGGTAGGNGGAGGSGGSLACDQCTLDNCAADTDGCDSISDPNDKQLCRTAYDCFVNPANACTNQGDAVKCWCGTNPTTCITDDTGPTKANGPCLDQVTLAARLTPATYVASSLRLRFSDPTFPLGRATNLAACRGGFCSVECGIP